MGKFCGNCGAEVSPKYNACGNCGELIKKEVTIKKTNPVVIVIIIVFGVLMLFGVLGSILKEDENNTNNKTTTTTIKKNDFDYTITNKYFGKYDIGYYIEGIVTNNKDKDYNYVHIEFICYDKNNNNLGTALDNISNLKAKQTWKYKAFIYLSDIKQIDHCEFEEISGW